MVDKIVELEDNSKYVLLDEKELNNIRYYYGLKLNDKEEPTDNYLFFEEIKDNNDIYLLPVLDEQIKGILATLFTINYVIHIIKLLTILK